MKGAKSQRPPYPTSWARPQGEGRVFSTAMGHSDEIWTHPGYQEILTAAIRWATGEVNAAIPTNLAQNAPEPITHPALPAAGN